MLARMAIFAGVPFFGSLLLFPFFYYLKVRILREHEYSANRAAHPDPGTETGCAESTEVLAAG